jgi:hypothetical protein
MKIVETLLIVIAILGFAHSAHAHGIAGNRFFPGTLSFDDPAVADESILPLFSSSKHPDEGATPSITGLPGGHLEKFLSPSRHESDSVTVRGHGRMERAGHGAEGLFRC